jgi:hypothetical protein
VTVSLLGSAGALVAAWTLALAWLAGVLPLVLGGRL